jgi:hypothetical protein
MAENTESSQFLEKLALITDAGQELFRGKMTLVFELGQTEYRYVNSLFEKQYDENLQEDIYDIQPQKKIKPDYSHYDYEIII